VEDMHLFLIFHQMMRSL